MVEEGGQKVESRTKSSAGLIANRGNSHVSQLDVLGMDGHQHTIHAAPIANTLKNKLHVSDCGCKCMLHASTEYEHTLTTSSWPVKE